MLCAWGRILCPTNRLPLNAIKTNRKTESMAPSSKPTQWRSQLRAKPAENLVELPKRLSTVRSNRVVSWLAKTEAIQPIDNELN
jgi:hypothetical protein